MSASSIKEGLLFTCCEEEGVGPPEGLGREGVPPEGLGRDGLGPVGRGPDDSSDF